MKIFELLHQCVPAQTKVHLAVKNPDGESPLDFFKQGNEEFAKYQNIQTRMNFSRKYILSLIQLDNKKEWLFAGIYKVLGHSKSYQRWLYETELTELYSNLIGRLVVNHERAGRMSYPYAENLSETTVAYIRPERLTTSEFSSFHDTRLSRSELETICRHEAKDWKAALSSVSGIYLITGMATDKLYIGSAYKLSRDGDGSLWSRWKTYANNYHGGNKLLKELYQRHGAEGFTQFHYSIIETFDTNASPKDVISREEEWKKRLRSVRTGYNSKG